MPKPHVRLFKTKTIPDEFWDTTLRSPALWIPTPNPHGLRALFYDPTSMRTRLDYANEKFGPVLHPQALLSHG